MYTSATSIFTAIFTVTTFFARPRSLSTENSINARNATDTFFNGHIGSRRLGPGRTFDPEHSGVGRWKNLTYRMNFIRKRVCGVNDDTLLLHRIAFFCCFRRDSNRWRRVVYAGNDRIKCRIRSETSHFVRNEIENTRNVYGSIAKTKTSIYLCAAKKKNRTTLNRFVRCCMPSCRIELSV